MCVPSYDNNRLNKMEAMEAILARMWHEALGHIYLLHIYVEL